MCGMLRNMEPEANTEQSSPSIIDDFVEMFTHFIQTDLQNRGSVQPCAYILAPANSIAALKAMQDEHTHVEAIGDEPLPDEVPEDGLNIIVMPLFVFGTEEEKDHCSEMIRKVAAQTNAQAVAFATEVWMLNESSSEEDRKAVAFGHKSISECEGKGEAIMLTIEEPGTVTQMLASKLWPEGENVGTPALGEWASRRAVPSDQIGGRMVNFLPCNHAVSQDVNDVRRKSAEEHNASLEKVIREYAIKAREAFEAADEATRTELKSLIAEGINQAQLGVGEEAQRAAFQKFITRVEELVGKKLEPPKIEIGTLEQMLARD